MEPEPHNNISAYCKHILDILVGDADPFRVGGAMYFVARHNCIGLPPLKTELDVCLLKALAFSCEACFKGGLHLP